MTKTRMHVSIALAYFEERAREGKSCMERHDGVPLTPAEVLEACQGYRNAGLRYWPDPECDNQRSDGHCAGHPVEGEK